MISKEQGPPVSMRTRAILAARGLTLSEVARRSRSLFPDDNRFHIPPNLYHTLQHRGFSPSVHQLLALSRLSGYRLVDWLAIFGVVLDDIPRLQAILPARYTTLIDENVYDDQSWILSFEPIAQGPPAGSLRPGSIGEEHVDRPLAAERGIFLRCRLPLRLRDAKPNAPAHSQNVQPLYLVLCWRLGIHAGRGRASRRKRAGIRCQTSY